MSLIKISSVSFLSAVILGSALIPIGVQAKPRRSSEPHYCGTQKTGRLIPDRPFGFDFSGACRTHDQCLDNGGSDTECLSLFKQELNSVCLNLPAGRNTKLSLFTTGDKYRGCLLGYAAGVGLNIGIKKLNQVRIIIPD
jgi:hypothetical protein